MSTEPSKDEVHELAGILFAIVEFLGGTFGKTPIVGFPMGIVFVLVRDDVGLCRAVVGIAEPGVFQGGLFPIWGSVRPAVGFVIADVKVFVISQGPARITAHIRFFLGRDVALFSKNDVVAIRIDTAGFFSEEDGEEALSGHFGGDGKTRELEECRGEIRGADEVFDQASGFDFGGPHDGQRDTGTAVVEVAFTAGEGHSVVACHDDDGVLQYIEFREFGKKTTDIGVKPLDFKVVVRNIAANGFVVGVVFEEFDSVQFHS